MKRFFNYLALAAIAATALISCNKEKETIVPEQETVSFTFASDKPQLFDADTRTVYEDGTIEWAEGDKIRVGIKVGETWMAAAGEPESDKYPKLYVSDALLAGGPTAQFKVPATFSLTNTGTYKFYGLYPSSLMSSTDAKILPNVAITIPATQKPLATTFDSSADVLFAVSEDYPDGIPSDRVISLTWNRVVAHADITLTKLPIFAEDETLSLIEFSAQDGANLVGAQTMSIVDGTISESTATGKNKITINPANVAVDNTNHTLEFWFSSLPFTATSIKVVLTTNKKIYTKEYTNISREFLRNRRNTITIGMKNAQEQEIVQPGQDIPNGDYVIAYKGGDDEVMMLSDNFISSTGSPDANARAFTVLPAVGSDGKIHTSANGVWHFEYKGNGKYVINSVQTGKYLKGTATTTYLSLEDNQNTFDGTYNESADTYRLGVTSGSDTRYIGFNASANPQRFAMYKGSAAQPVDLTLIPAVGTLRCDKPVISFATPTVTITCTTEGANIYYTIDGTEPTASSTLYAGAFDLDETATVKAIAVKADYADSEVASLECVVVPVKTIAQVLAEGVVDSQTVTNATVMAFRSGNYIIADGTGVMLMYKTGTQISVGSVITATGSVVEYYGVLEFKPTTYSEGSGTATDYGTPENFDEAAFTAYKTAPVTKYVTFRGVVPSSGYEVSVGSNIVNIYGDIPTDMRGNHCVLTGYIYGLPATGNNAGKINFMLTDIELDTAFPSIEVDPASLVWEATETASKSFTVTAENGGFSVTPASGSLSYFSYTVSGDVVTVSLKGDVTATETETLTITNTADASVYKTVTLTRKFVPQGGYTLDPVAGSDNGYASNEDIEIGGITWNVTGNSTFVPWRLGGKNLSGVDRAIYSKTKMASNMGKIVITHGAASSITVNSMKVIVASDANFTNVVSELTPTFVANGSVTVNRPAGADWSNCYYKIVYNVSVSGNTNRYIQFVKAEFTAN